MSLFERFLTLWVALCIVAGVVLGRLFPGIFQAIGGVEVAQVNLPVALLIWLMIIPMLMKVDFAALGEVRAHWRGIGVTLLINWAIKPFSMAAFGWLFVGLLFRPYLPSDQITSHIAGLILLAAAPCTAMVFVWSNLAGGEPHFTLSQVALNDTIMVFAFLRRYFGEEHPPRCGTCDRCRAARARNSRAGQSRASHSGEARRSHGRSADPRNRVHDEKPAGMISDQLRLMFEWYKGMVDESTGRLLYLYDPQSGLTTGDGEPIREIAAIWDIEVRSAFLGRDDLLPLIRRSLNYFRRFIVERDKYAIIALA